MTQKIVLSRLDYITLQIKEACGSENKWFAGEVLGRSPTDQEALEHYCDKGGARSFSEIYIPEDALPE